MQISLFVCLLEPLEERMCECMRIASVFVCYICLFFLPSVFQLKWREVGVGVGKIYNRPFQHLLR